MLFCFDGDSDDDVVDYDDDYDNLVVYGDSYITARVIHQKSSSLMKMIIIIRDDDNDDNDDDDDDDDDDDTVKFSTRITVVNITLVYVTLRV